MNQKSKMKSKQNNVGLTHLPLSAKIFIAIFALIFSFAISRLLFSFLCLILAILALNEVRLKLICFKKS